MRMCWITERRRLQVARSGEKCHQLSGQLTLAAAAAVRLFQPLLLSELTRGSTNPRNITSISAGTADP